MTATQSDSYEDALASAEKAIQWARRKAFMLKTETVFIINATALKELTFSFHQAAAAARIFGDAVQAAEPHWWVPPFAGSEGWV